MMAYFVQPHIIIRYLSFKTNQETEIEKMFNFFKKKKSDKDQNKIPRIKLSFTDKLDMVKYFEFTDSNEKEVLVNNIQEFYSKTGSFSTTYKNDKSTCNKYFFCDNEDLFEHGGFKSQLEYMRIGFEKVIDFNKLLNSIPESFNFEANSKSNWNDAVVEFTNLVNQFLQSEKSEYNIYPANAGNEGLMYILSEQQFSLLNKHIDDRPVRPQNIESWNRIYNTTQEEYRKYIERDEFQFKFGMTMNLKNHGKVKVIKVINDKSAEIQVGDKIGRIDLITGKYRLTFNNDESNQTEQIPKSFAQPEDLKVGMNIKHLKFGKGKIMDITNKGVANIKFEDGEKRIILEYAKLEIVE